jgi:hypothetical protein
MIRIWKDPRQKLSWRHGVIFLFWLATFAIAAFFIVSATICDFLGEGLDMTYGKLKHWANPDAYIHRDLLPPLKEANAVQYNIKFNVEDYLNADRDSITQPYPNESLREPPTR